LAASFSHHNVITVFDFDQADDGSLYIVMEYIDGRNLSEVIRDHPMDLGVALSLGIQIAGGLSAAHRAGVIHRDIKPENIMVVAGDKEIKLMDFGIARLRDRASATKLTQTGMIMGTPVYMAPEQIEGGELSERTDIYAFGIVLYEMLTGNVPFKAATPGAILVKHLHEAPTPPTRIRKEVPASVDRIVIQALQKNPEKRQKSMDEVVEALKRAQRDAEQFGLGGRQGLAPQMAAVRRGFSAVAAPFRKLLRQPPSGSDEPDRDIPLDTASSAELSHEEPALPAALGNPTQVEEALATAVTEPLDDLSPRELNLADEIEEPAAGILTQASWAEPQAAVVDDATDLAPPPDGSIADTVAFTQPIEIPEHLPPDPQIVEDETRLEDEGTPLPESLHTIEAERIDFDAFSEPPRTDASEIVDEPQQPEPAVAQENLEQLPHSPYQEPPAAGFSTNTTSVGSETIAETAALTQPIETIEKVAPQKKSWLVAAVISFLVVAASLFGGLKISGYFNSAPPEPAAKNEPIDSKQTEANTSQSQSRDFTREIIESKDENKVATPLSKPIEPTIDVPVAKALPLREEIKPSVKGAEKPAARPTLAAVKKPDTPPIKELESRPHEKTVSAQPEPKPYLPPPAEVVTKNPDWPSKKAQELLPEPRTAALKPYDPPAPPPVARRELRDISIITNKRDLKIKERMTLSLKGRYSDGTETELGAGVQWKSSDSSIASVNSRGELEALKEGTAQISATYDGVASRPYAFTVKASEESRKPEDSGAQIKDLRRRLLR
jgi:hypothetical protein